MVQILDASGSNPEKSLEPEASSVSQFSIGRDKKYACNIKGKPCRMGLGLELPV